MDKFKVTADCLMKIFRVANGLVIRYCANKIEFDCLTQYCVKAKDL